MSDNIKIMKKLLYFVLGGMLMYGCSGNQQSSDGAGNSGNGDNTPVAIVSDMESPYAGVASWINEKTLVKMPEGLNAHSGQYVSRVNAENIYSYAFRESFVNINQKLPTAVIIEGWFYPTEPITTEGIVMDINENNKNVIWKSFNLASGSIKLNEWNSFRSRFLIDKEIKSNYQLKIFGIGKGKTLYFDDFKISFEY